jgi:acylphosphatase
MAAKRIFISGKVQGVSFRFHTHEKARALGLRGWVRNLDDGRVEMVLSGDERKIQEVIKWAQIGPPSAKVEKVVVEDFAGPDGRDMEIFYIRRDGNQP